MGVAGASRYLNAATLANQRGFVSAQTDLISNFGSIDLLDIARGGLKNNGIGISSNARALNKSFLSSSSQLFNSVFSLNVAGTSSVEGLQTQIAALRSSLPESSLARDLRGVLVDEDA